MTPREPCVFTPKFSPKSLLPTSSSCNETHCKMKDKSPASKQEGSNTDKQPERLNGQQPGLDEDIIGDAITQLEINDDTKMSFSSSQTCGTSQHTVQAIYQGQQNYIRNGENTKKQIQRQVQHAHEVHDQEQRTEIGDISETKWRQEEREGQHDQQIRGEPQACLFVASLAASRTDIQLVESVTEHFKKWGPLLNVKHVEHAQKAILEAQNTIIDGRHIRIEQARVNRTLFVLKFKSTMTEQACIRISQDLIPVLEQYGPIEDVSIFHDLGSLSNRRYAFAKFAYRDDAIRAYMSLRSNSKWTVEWAPNLSCQNQIEKESVFIGQLNPDLVTETALRERFQAYGNIQHIHLVKRNRPGTNKPTAFAFIEFDDENSAKEAIESENAGTEHESGQETVGPGSIPSNAARFAEA
ncbi:hypothetical protein BGX21_001035 [Mortierella sp. AD011]|nr:hypothetical protein BGX20_009642 [Mortierella sp. AD010]KAF9403662.1 hypothetical protein BGX21_001035 [Mortierella sp. AD011]